MKEIMPSTESNEKINDELKSFLKQVIELDQSDPQRSKAKEALDLLRSRKDDFIGSAYEEEYWGDVSFELFHLAQRDAVSANKDLAVVKLKDSLKAAEKGWDENWANYVQGTLAYFEKNIDILKKCIEKEELNKEVLKRLKNGLLERGDIDYAKDYADQK